MAIRVGDRERTGGLGGFGQIVDIALAQNRLVEILRPHQALALWAEIAGERIAAAAEAEAVRGRTLVVRTKSSVWANELTFFKADLLERLNCRLGGAYIADIHFQTGNRSERPRRTNRAVSAAASQPAPILAADEGAAIPDCSRLDMLVARTRATLEWKRSNGWIECARCRALYPPSESRDPIVRTRRRTSRRRNDICPICSALANR